MDDAQSWRLSERRTQDFDSVATQYDTHRRPFPSAVFEGLASAADVRPGTRVVEVGSGTGRATLPLLELGCSVRCVEPGPGLATVAQAKLASFDGVEWIVGRFEDVALPPESADVVFAADSWHWVEPARGATAAARVLGPSGVLAICWWRWSGFEPEGFLDAVRAAWESAAPGAGSRLADLTDDGAAWIQATAATGLFGPARRTTIAAPIELDSSRLIEEMRTYGWVLAMEPPLRERLLEATGRLIDDRFGGRVRRLDEALLYVLRRR